MARRAREPVFFEVEGSFLHTVNKELERYFPIADMLARTFGRNCEVVIHDLSVPQNSVVYTANNHVTGRQVGQPFDHLVRQVLLSKKFEREYAANYLTHDAAGRPVKSSTVLLRGSGDKVIGALCINLGVAPMRELAEMLDEMLYIDHEDVANGTEVSPDEHIQDIVVQLIDRIVGDRDVAAMDRQTRISLISFMESKGLFMVKGAIDRVAERLGISRVTVYSYLDELRKENGKDASPTA